MTKPLLKCLFFILLCTTFFFSRVQGQTLIKTGLVEDLEQGGPAPAGKTAQMKTTAAAASAYTDTLRLPFFEDFTDVVVPIDSIVIDNTTDSYVKIYNKVLNSFPDSTYISVGFTKPKANATTDRIARTNWFIKKIGPNEFILDSTKNGIDNTMQLNKDTVIRNGFWRLLEKKYSTQLDSLKWLPNGNTYINNRYPLEPVSYNVATFDGLKSDGIPYNTTAVLAKGFSDNLTSLPINLKGLLPADSIYLSFFWQHSGIGDAPESEDYIQLEFKDSTGTWQVVHTINGNIPYMNDFDIKLVPVINPVFFSKHFQFRFRSWGRLSGPFDIWNVDYIYLDKNRTVYDTIFNDKSIGNLPVTFLKDFTAMPYNQYFANPTAASGDMPFTLNNLGRGIAARDIFYAVADYFSRPDNILISRDTSVKYFSNDTVPTASNARTYHDICTPDVSSFSSTTHPIYVEQTFRMFASDTLNILLVNNNKFSTKTILWDYYAYDDGSPEGAVAGDQIGAKIANKYTINLLDTLTDIDIYFTRSRGPNMSGRSILLSVWDNSKTLVSQQIVQVAYGGYKRYTLATPVIVPAGSDYYVGYQQNFVDLLTVGYDRNYDHSNKTYYNLSGNNWTSYDQVPGYTKGSMMIRPVFSKNQNLITPVISNKESIHATLYPVPTNDVLKIEGKLSEIILYDFTGRKLASKTFDPFEEDKEIDVSTLSNGLYIVELKQNDTFLIKKIIIQHEF